MKDYLAIKSIHAREVLDSRGHPTVEVEAITDGGFQGTAIVPSGASTGGFEAIELRDNDSERYMGKGVLEAVKNVNDIISKKLKDTNVYDQILIDRSLIEMDNTENKAILGANAILGVSLAVAKAAAESLGMSLYRYIGGANAKTLPVPMMNILNGGKHADNNINIQEFMIVPLSAEKFSKSIQMCTEVYHTLKFILKSEGHATSVGDEGGFAPNFKNDEEALKYIIKAIEKANYIPSVDFGIALDIASTEMYNEANKIGEKDKYYFWKTGELKTREELVNYYENLINEYPIISIEDGFAEADWDGWKVFTEKLSKIIQIVGDDIFATNTHRLEAGISKRVANSILIKPNQVGTLTETLDAIELAKQSGYKTIISHRSGETEDTTIADIAVAVNAGQIKTGAPCRSERVAKYNRLLRIEEELKY